MTRPPMPIGVRRGVGCESEEHEPLRTRRCTKSNTRSCNEGSRNFDMHFLLAGRKLFILKISRRWRTRRPDYSICCSHPENIADMRTRSFPENCS